MTLTGSTALDQSLAGFTAGGLSTLILHPLDLIKIRFQVAQHHQSTRQLILSLIQSHGYKSLYRGVIPNFAGSTLSWGLYFGWYSLIKDAMARSNQNNQLSASHHLIASAQAGGSKNFNLYRCAHEFMYKSHLGHQDAHVHSKCI